MGRESSLEGMCELFSQDEIALTKQGIDFRFTQDGVNFMRALYEESLNLIQAKEQIIPFSGNKFYGEERIFVQAR